MQEKITEKIRGNAISAYLLMFISLLFLFNKSNSNINNQFVKKHTKSAISIHLGFLITYIVFISNGLFLSINILGVPLNNIIADIIFSILLILLIIGMYKAKNNKEFNITKDIQITSNKKILDIDGDGKISEKEKLTILLSFVPFIGFINFGKYSTNETINTSTRFNVIVSLLIILLYAFGYGSLSTLLLLVYTIFIAYIGITLFTSDKLVQIILPKGLSPSNTYLILKASYQYFKNYFNDKDFKVFNDIYTDILENKNNFEEKQEIELKKKKELKLPKFLIYIPVINLIFIFYRNSKYNFHIINSLVITILLALSGILASYGYLTAKFHILALFPILFGIGSIKYKLAYKLPIIFDLYILISKLFKMISFGTKKIKEKSKEENEIHLKVK